ncbi:MAG: zinc ribbon domain-containing protein [Deltaproteobacteria bacterium]|nr:zinc ribbon domain-containing protein [Deltaproteobacteria bacterium]
MPLFEYRCSACGHLEEVLQKLSDPAPDPCPKCGVEKTMGKELSLSAFHLKGGGWYKDLYASSSSSSTTEAKGDTKSETKSEASTKSGGAETKTESTTTSTPAAAPAAAPVAAPKPAAA